MVVAIDENHAITNASLVALATLVASIPGASKVDVTEVETVLRHELRGIDPKGPRFHAAVNGL
jgi:hypothetical protein